MEAPPIILDPSKLPVYEFFVLDKLSRVQELEMEKKDKEEDRHL